jgi:putative addiction module antidote
MPKKITVRKMGGSLGATLPKEMTDRMQIQDGDVLYAVETERGVLLTPYDPAFDRAMQLYQRGARKYRNALRELAE